MALAMIRIGVSAGLIFWVFHKFIDVRQLVDLAKRTDRGLLAVALGIEVLPILFTTWRWQLLLKPVGLRPGFLRTLHFNYLGLFFNNFLLGLTGGDVVKAFLIARGTDRKAGAILTVFVDRLTGLVTLAGIAAVACFTRLHDPRFRVPTAVVWGFLAAFSLFCLVYFNPRVRDLTWVRRLRLSLPGRRILDELDEAGQAYGGKWGILGGAAVLSIASHACSLLAAWLFARAMGAGISLVDILIYVPVIMMIVSVPISIGSWGVGEGAFITFFRQVGMRADQATMLSLLVRLGQAIWTVPGGVLLLIPTERNAIRQAEEDAEEEAGKL